MIALVVHLLRLLFGVEVVQVPVELVESMHGRQVVVAVPEMVLPDLRRHVSPGA
jgi:hypothetical protein